MKLKKYLKVFYKDYLIGNCINPFYLSNKTKFFCIGMNKTGTTSMKKAFEDLGYSVGNQRLAERLTPYYHKRDFGPIIKYCRTAQVFQDVPFSWLNTYKILDQAFPDSKFILTIRDSPEQWYHSVINFHSKRFGHFPTAEDLKNSNYVWKGWEWENKVAYWGITDENDIWNKGKYVKRYIQHNNDVEQYFKVKYDKLLIINLSKSDSYNRFTEFLNIKSPYKEFPWENKTCELN